MAIIQQDFENGNSEKGKITHFYNLKSRVKLYLQRLDNVKSLKNIFLILC